MRTEGKKVVLEFTNTGTGLVARGGTLRRFEIAGTDRKFVNASARIAGNEVLVWNDTVTAPAVVRYAWADNPAGANLYNNEGLPASPFETGR
jgi:sialate O-acetylesterase